MFLKAGLILELCLFEYLIFSSSKKGDTMKLLRIVFVITFLFSMSFSANAEDYASKFLALVHPSNFVGCDSAILKEFDEYINAPTGRVTTNYFRKGGNSFSVTATWGKAGDSIYQTSVFEKDGTTCRAYQISMIQVEDNCVAYKEKNPVWTYIEATGDFLWTKNKGGVKALMHKGGQLQYCRSD